jgi:hypothetical protein
MALFGGAAQSSDVRLWGLNRPKLAAPEGRLLTPYRTSRIGLRSSSPLLDLLPNQGDHAHPAIARKWRGG